MAERNLIERLDLALDALVAGRPADAAADPEIALLLAIGADLLELPSPAFKARLKEELMPVQADLALKPGFHTINPYLILRDAAELMDFVRDAFGGQERLRVPDPAGKLMHGEVLVGDCVIEMGDAGTLFTPRPSALHLYVEDTDATYAQAIRAGGIPMYAPVDQPYGDREAGVKDRWGNHWYIATPLAGIAREGVRTVTPFLHPVGADRLIDYLTRAFGATPVGEPARGPEGRIAHAVMQIGDSVIEMGEAHGEWQPMALGIHLYVPDVDSAYARAVAAGSKPVAPPEDKPYGERGGAVEDPFGNLWFIATPK
jgi:uncharacterized glyoxalase superfamily protein PhnB